MRAVIQRVSESSVVVDGKTVGQIGKGLTVLLGIEDGDAEQDVDYIVNKTLGLRVFEDREGKMNESVQDIRGQLLAIPQFTLLGDVRKGKRPNFMAAAKPEQADSLYRLFVQKVQSAGTLVQEGIFQADMLVNIQNDGPVTILLDSRKLF